MHVLSYNMGKLRMQYVTTLIPALCHSLAQLYTKLIMFIWTQHPVNVSTEVKIQMGSSVPQ